MSKKKRNATKGADEAKEPLQPKRSPETEDDTEGHGLDRLMAVETLSGRRAPVNRRPTTEELPPLTKTWPRLREDRPKG